MVGIVLVSHSFELAHGLADLTAQVAGDEVRIEPAGGGPDGSLGTSGDTVREAISRADRGQGVVVLADLGSSILTVRHLLEGHTNGHIRLVDAPFVEGAVAAAVMSAAGQSLDDVVRAAEEARGASKF
ncbi:MAG TPA: dihydroxyacetone kinase phosphoryl donor subunit DhaM [Candidatus Dormibacteraeota bacterium]|jgi:PTS hybrid protein